MNCAALCLLSCAGVRHCGGERGKHEHVQVCAVCAGRQRPG